MRLDHHDYDERDLLYLSAQGYEALRRRRTPARRATTVEHDEAGRAIAMTLVNVRWLLERNGELTITWPTGRVKAAELSEVLASAA